MNTLRRGPKNLRRNSLSCLLMFVYLMRPQIAIYEDANTDIYKSKGNLFFHHTSWQKNKPHVVLLRFYHVKSSQEHDSFFREVEISLFLNFWLV